MVLNRKIIPTQTANDIYSELLEITATQVVVNGYIKNDKSLIERVRSFRLILEKLFFELSSDMDNAELVNNASRMEYVFNKFSIDKEIIKESKTLRAFLNKFHHAEYNQSITHEDYLLYLKTLCKIVHYFSNTDIPEELQDIYKTVKDKNLYGKPEAPKIKINFAKVSINKIKEENNQLILYGTDEFTSENIYIYINKNNEYLYYLKDIVLAPISQALFLLNL